MIGPGSAERTDAFPRFLAQVQPHSYLPRDRRDRTDRMLK